MSYAKLASSKVFLPFGTFKLGEFSSMKEEFILKLVPIMPLTF